jgi:hypothetical protein
VSLVNLGNKMGDQYEYTAPDGTEYTHDAWFDKDNGNMFLTGSSRWVPDAGSDGSGTGDVTFVNPSRQTYSQAQVPDLADLNAQVVTPNLQSTTTQVQQALQSGQVTQTGTVTVDGRQAIALSITPRPIRTRRAPSRSTRRCTSMRRPTNRWRR